MSTVYYYGRRNRYRFKFRIYRYRSESLCNGLVRNIVVQSSERIYRFDDGRCILYLESSAYAKLVAFTSVGEFRATESQAGYVKH